MENWLELVVELARSNGNVVSRQQLLRAGVPSKTIEELRAAGKLAVVRRGWYRISGARAIAVAAVKEHAAVTCVSALPLHSSRIWIPPNDAKVHLRWPPHRRAHQRTHEQCTAFRPLGAPTSAVDGLETALLCAANCLDPDVLVAVLDSTLRMEGPLTEENLREIFAGAPQRIARVLRHLDPLAGSGTESIVRYRLRCKHIAVRSQVTIPGLGRVDLLVGVKLIIECDSTGHHGGDQRKADLKRDRKAEIGDYHVLRIDYDEVMTDWDAVYKDIAEIVHTDRHVGKVRPIPVPETTTS